MVEGLIAAALLLAGGLAALKTATVAAALPFTIVMLLMGWGMIRALRLEIVKRVSLCRAEVHLREGSQAYDVMGWSKRDVIDDVLDQYERHMHFLTAVR